MPILRVHINENVWNITFIPGRSVREILDETDTRVRSGCNGSGACGLCKIRIEEGEVRGPTAKEQIFLDESYISRGMRLACQVIPTGDLVIDILNPARRSSWRSFSAEHRYLVRKENLIPGITCNDTDFVDGDTYGIAIDLGTTQISLLLVSLINGRSIAARCGRNPQEVIGSDVMTRLVAASESEIRAKEMSDQVIRAIGEGIHDIASREGIDLNRVSALTLVGNTAMLALLTSQNYTLLIRPETWMETIDYQPENTCAWKKAWEIPDEATVEVIRPVGGFVGSDLLAGVLATGLVDNPKTGLLIDFGTNSEIALWDGKTLQVTSAAGGPAFEGCGIRSGLPAEPGAICQVRFTDRDLELRTIAGEKARGLCGTGIIDLIAGLVRSGILTGKGQFAPAYAGNGYVLPVDEPLLTLTKKDVDLFQRAKAAIGAGIQILLKEAGLGYRDLDRVFIGGTFGKSLDIDNAISIGLIPPVPTDRIELCGNIALAGCELALLSLSAYAHLCRTRQEARVINLAENQNFEDSYLENLYLMPMEDT